MDLSEIQEIWEPYMEQCVNNPAEGFESVNLTFIGTGDQKCEEFFNYDKYVIFSTRAKLWLNETYTFLLCKTSFLGIEEEGIYISLWTLSILNIFLNALRCN